MLERRTEGRHDSTPKDGLWSILGTAASEGTSWTLTVYTPIASATRTSVEGAGE